MWDWLDHPCLPYMQIKVLLFRACNGFVVIKQSSQFKVYGLLGTVCLDTLTVLQESTGSDSVEGSDGVFPPFC